MGVDEAGDHDLGAEIDDLEGFRKGRRAGLTDPQDLASGHDDRGIPKGPPGGRIDEQPALEYGGFRLGKDPLGLGGGARRQKDGQDDESSDDRGRDPTLDHETLLESDFPEF